jgi:ATPase family protein associated with various cellular activities (AAA)
MSQMHDLELLINSRYPFIEVATEEEDRLADMLRRLAARLGIPFYTWTAVEGLTRAPFKGAATAHDREPLQALVQVAATREDGIYLFKDLHKYLEDPATVRRLRDLAPVLGRGRRTLILAGAHLDLPPEIRALSAVFKLELPTVDELKTLVQDTVRGLMARGKTQIQLEGSDLDLFAESLRGLTLFEAERALYRAAVDDLALTPSDREGLIDFKKQVIERDGHLEFWPRLDDLAAVGGLEKLKAWLARRRNAFGDAAHRFGLDPPKGLLLLGVQGCGKSLCAKAIAKEWQLPLLKMEPGRLYDKFIGESEKRLERALDVACRLAPVVLWVDEIEKGFAMDSQSETDAGLSRRIFGRLLAWLQDRPAPVFVIATCNDVTSLPPELMRKGRFDEIFFVDLPGPEERGQIFSIHLKKRHRDPAAFDLDLLARVSEGFSGAEIEQALVSALYAAFASSGDLTTELVLRELQTTRPLSVVRAEEVGSLRFWAASRTVPAS